jgi:hypothetical protein
MKYGPHAKEDDMSEIVLLQTADTRKYLEMLQVTAAVNQAYCARHNISYSQFVGTKRGFHPWHASFNRIILVKEMIDAGFDGWVFYLDADAFVADLSLDVRQLIAGVEKPLIMAPSGVTRELWDVNNGVFIVDIGNEVARNLMLAWYNFFMSISDESLLAAVEWAAGPDDQAMLHKLLRENGQFRNCLGLVDLHYLNHHTGSFVRQILRANAKTWEERLERVRKETLAVLYPENSEH